MAKNGLDKWFAQKWVDIGSKKKENVNIQNVSHLQKQDV